MLHVQVELVATPD